MKSVVKFEDPGDLEATLTITCTVRDLRKMREQLKNKTYECWLPPLDSFYDAITQSIAKVETEFYGFSEDE